MEATINTGCVSLAPKQRVPLPRLRLWLTPITRPGMGSKLLQSCKRGRNSTYFVVRTVERRNRPHCFHALVEFGEIDVGPTLVVRLSGVPARDPNQLNALPVIDYQRLRSRRSQRNAHNEKQQQKHRLRTDASLSHCGA